MVLHVKIHFFKLLFIRLVSKRPRVGGRRILLALTQ